MKIIADDAIPWLHEAFAALGDVRAHPGRRIANTTLADADILLTRSITTVNRALLAGTNVRFVGSATAGVDHVDVEALGGAGIAFAHAPGCNATAVVEYVITALALAFRNRELDGRRFGPVGVVGFGQVGRRLTARLRALGFTVWVSDPPLERRRAEGRLPSGPPWWVAAGRDEPLLPLDTLCRRCEVVTAHVPLTTVGASPTAALIGAAELDALGPDALVVNTCRGGVVDEAALSRWLDDGRGRAVLDVWATEPAPSPTLLGHPRVVLATPHIAGYTLEGKVGGTRAVHDAVCRWSDRPPAFTGARVLGSPGATDLEADAAASLTEWLLAANPIDDANANLRAGADAFESLRRGYRFRREFSHFRMPRGAAAQTRRTLEVLGFGADPE